MENEMLTLTGRATLVQSTISAITYFSLQTTKLPRYLCDDFDRKARKFLGGLPSKRRSTKYLRKMLLNLRRLEA